MPDEPQFAGRVEFAEEAEVLGVPTDLIMWREPARLVNYCKTRPDEDERLDIWLAVLREDADGILQAIIDQPWPDEAVEQYEVQLEEAAHGDSGD